MILENLKAEILKGNEIEDVLEKIDWKEFEETVSQILINNDFKVIKNFRFKTDRRYEIDILASRNEKGLAIDCKEWRRGRYKRSGIISSVRKQERRVEELKKILKKNPISENYFGKVKILKSLIITLMDEQIVKENDTFVVPVSKLNSFLTEIEKYI